MVEFQPSKLVAWVRFPSLAPTCALSSVDRVPGYEPVGRRFESSRARHKERDIPCGCLSLCFVVRPAQIRALHLPCKCEGSHTPHGDRKARFSGEVCGYLHHVNTLRSAPQRSGVIFLSYDAFYIARDESFAICIIKILMLKKRIASFGAIRFLFYFTTMLIILPGTTISLTIVLPSIAWAIFSSDLTIARISSLLESLAILSTFLTLPFT